VGAPVLRVFAKGGSRKCRPASAFDHASTTKSNITRIIATHPCKQRKDGPPSLVGFTGAYGKIATHGRRPDEGHRIRVVGLEPGSARILIDVVEWTSKNPAAAGVLVTGIGLIGGAAYKVVKDIAAVIWGKKALKGENITNNSYTFNDNCVILNGVELTPEQLEYLQSGDLDPDLDRMTRPLERGANEFKLRTRDEDLATVTADERPFFYSMETDVTMTRDDVWLEGTLNSHSKRSTGECFTLWTANGFDTAMSVKTSSHCCGRMPTAVWSGCWAGSTSMPSSTPSRLTFRTSN
jgi:hypothetical protein